MQIPLPCYCPPGYEGLSPMVGDTERGLCGYLREARGSQGMSEGRYQDLSTEAKSLLMEVIEDARTPTFAIEAMERVYEIVDMMEKSFGD